MAYSYDRIRRSGTMPRAATRSRAPSSSVGDVDYINPSQIISSGQITVTQGDIQRRAGQVVGKGTGVLSDKDIERLSSIATGTPDTWMPDWSVGLLTGLARVAEPISRIGRMSQMLIWDVANTFDEDTSIQFTLDDYWDTFRGDMEEVARDNPGVMGEDMRFSGSQQFDMGIMVGDNQFKWEKTENGINNFLRFLVATSYEALVDPINLFTGGASGASKAALVKIADIGLQEAMVVVAKYADDLGEAFLTHSVDDMVIGTVEGTSRLHRTIFEGAQSSARDIVKTQTKLSGRELVDQAFRRNRDILVPGADGKTWDFINPRDIPGVEDLSPDAAWFVGVDRVVDELGGLGPELNWFGEIRNNIAGTIARKQYGDQGTDWLNWIDHTERATFSSLRETSSIGSTLAMTTGGITYGLPFGQQHLIPGVTALTRGRMSNMTRAVRGRISDVAPWYDTMSNKLGYKLAGENSSMIRIAEQSGIRSGFNQSSITTFAQYASLADVRHSFKMAYSDVAGAAIAQNTVDDFYTKVLKELKKANITKRKGGKEALADIQREMGRAFSGGDETVNLKKLKLPFTVSKQLQNEAQQTLDLISNFKLATEQRGGMLLPEMAEALAMGRKYTPVYESFNGNKILAGIANTKEAPAESFSTLIRKMQISLKNAGNTADADVAMENVRSVIERSAHQGGYLTADEHITSQDVLLFFSMVDQMNPRLAVLPEGFGTTSVFKTRRTGNNAMFVYSEIEDPRIMNVFTDPSIMNRRMSAIAHTITDDMPNKDMFDKLWKKANGDLFETDPATLINHWFTAINTAILARLDAGVMLRTGMASQADHIALWSEALHVLSKDMQESTMMQVAMLMRQKLSRIVNDPALREAAIRGGHQINDDIPTARVMYARWSTLEVPVDIISDPVVAQTTDELGAVARVLVDNQPTAPARFRAEVDKVMSDRNVSDLEAQKIVMGERVEVLAPTLGKLEKAFNAAVDRKYRIFIDQAREHSDEPMAVVLEAAAVADKGKLASQIEKLWRQFAKASAGVTDEAAPVPGIKITLDSDVAVNDFFKAARAGKMASNTYRKAQIAAITDDLKNLNPNSTAHHNLAVQKELLEAANTMAKLADDGLLPWDTIKVKVFSGGQNGVDIETVRRASQRGMETGGWIPAGLIDDEARALGRNPDELLAEYKTYGYRVMTEDYKGFKPDTYPARTMRNVDENDLTVVYMPGAGGAKYRQGNRMWYFKGGSADTIHYARTGKWPVRPEKGFKKTFKDSQLTTYFHETAPGVWVVSDDTKFVRPVVIISHVAESDNDFMQYSAVQASRQHQAIRTEIQRRAVNDEIKVNMAGPRSEVHDLTDVLGKSADDYPFLLDPAAKSTERRAFNNWVRFGEIPTADGEGIAFSALDTPRYQSVQEVVARYNAMVQHLHGEATRGGGSRPGAGSAITVKDLLEWNLSEARFIERNVEILKNVYEIKGPGDKRILDTGAQMKLDLNQMAADAEAAGTDFLDVLAFEIARYQRQGGSIYQSGGRIYGQMTHTGSPELRGPSWGAGSTTTPLGKTLAVNEHNKNKIVQMWEMYKDRIPVEEHTDDLMERYIILVDMQRGKSKFGRIHDDIQHPFDYIETPVTIEGAADRPVLLNKYGDIIGFESTSADDPITQGFRWEAMRAYSADEEIRIRSAAVDQGVPNAQRKPIYQLVEELQSMGVSPSRHLKIGGESWADVGGGEVALWEAALELTYDVADMPTHARLYESIVPVAEIEFQRMMMVIRDRGGKGIALGDLIEGTTLEHAVGVRAANKLEMQMRLEDRALTGDTDVSHLFDARNSAVAERIVTEDKHKAFLDMDLTVLQRAEQERLRIRLIEIDEFIGAIDESMARGKMSTGAARKALAEEAAEPPTVDEVLYEAMSAWLATRGIDVRPARVGDPAPTDVVYGELMNRYGVIGSATSNTHGSDVTKINGPRTGAGLADIDDYELAQQMMTNLEDDVLSDIVYKGIDDAFDITNDPTHFRADVYGELFDNRNYSEAERLLLYAEINGNVGFAHDAVIRLPPRTPYKNKKYYSPNYRGGWWSDFSVSEQKMLSELPSVTSAKAKAETFPVNDPKLYPSSPAAEWEMPPNMGASSSPTLIPGNRADVLGEGVDDVVQYRFEGRGVKGVDPQDINELGAPRQIRMEPNEDQLKSTPEWSNPNEGVNLTPGQGTMRFINLERDSSRIVDMFDDLPAGISITSKLGDIAVRADMERMEQWIRPVFAVLNKGNASQLAVLGHVNVDAAGRAWRMYQSTLEPSWLFNAELVKAVALASLIKNNKLNVATIKAFKKQAKLFNLPQLDDLPPVERLVEKVVKGAADTAADIDPLYTQASTFVVQHGSGSIKALQGELKVGAARAKRIAQALEDAGVLGAPGSGRGRSRAVIADAGVAADAPSPAVLDNASVALSAPQRKRFMELWPGADAPDTIDLAKLKRSVTQLQAAVAQDKKAAARAASKAKVAKKQPPSKAVVSPPKSSSSLTPTETLDVGRDMLSDYEAQLRRVLNGKPTTETKLEIKRLGGIIRALRAHVDGVEPATKLDEASRALLNAEFKRRRAGVEPVAPTGRTLEVVMGEMDAISVKTHGFHNAGIRNTPEIDALNAQFSVLATEQRAILARMRGEADDVPVAKTVAPVGAAREQTDTILNAMLLDYELELRNILKTRPDGFKQQVADLGTKIRMVQRKLGDTSQPMEKNAKLAGEMNADFRAREVDGVGQPQAPQVKVDTPPEATSATELPSPAPEVKVVEDIAPELTEAHTALAVQRVEQLTFLRDVYSEVRAWRKKHATKVETQAAANSPAGDLPLNGRRLTTRADILNEKYLVRDAVNEGAVELRRGFDLSDGPVWGNPIYLPGQKPTGVAHPMFTARKVVAPARKTVDGPELYLPTHKFTGQQKLGVQENVAQQAADAVYEYIPYPYAPAKTQAEAVGRYQDVLWDWIEQHAGNAGKVRALYGRRIVQYARTTTSLPYEARVLAEAADRLYHKLGRPQNRWLSTDARVLNEIQEAISDEVVGKTDNMMRGIYERQFTNIDGIYQDVEDLFKLRAAERQNLASQFTDKATPDKPVPMTRKYKVASDESSSTVLADDMTIENTKEILSVAARVQYGPGAMVDIEVDLATGRLKAVVRMADDQFNVIDDVATTAGVSRERFDKIVEAYRKGEVPDIEKNELAIVRSASNLLESIDNGIAKGEAVVKAVDAGIKTDLAPSPKVLAEITQTKTDFNNLLRTMYIAVSQGKPAAFRSYIGVKDGVLTPSQAWQRVRAVLDNAADDQTRDTIMFWIEAAQIADFGWDDIHQWRRQFLEMEAPHRSKTRTTAGIKTNGSRRARTKAKAKADSGRQRPWLSGAETYAAQKANRETAGAYPLVETVSGSKLTADEIVERYYSYGIDPRQNRGRSVRLEYDEAMSAANRDNPAWDWQIDPDVTIPKADNTQLEAYLDFLGKGIDGAGAFKRDVLEQYNATTVRINALIADLDQLAGLWDTVDGTYGIPFADASNPAISMFRDPKAKLPHGQGTAYDVARAGERDSFRELYLGIENELDMLSEDVTLRGLVTNHQKMRDSDGIAVDALTDADLRTMEELVANLNHFDDLDSPMWVPQTRQPGFVPAESAGLAGALGGAYIDPIVAREMSRSQKRLATVMSNQGVSELAHGVRALKEWWKRAATIARLPFHERNLIGGMWNNMMIGVGPQQHLRMAPDVLRFLRAKRRMSLWNHSDEEVGAVLEHELYSHVSDKYYDLFKAADREGIFDDSFASTLGHTRVRFSKLDNVNPFSPNFYPYRLGGDMMENVEGVLRMSAFSKYYDADMPVLSSRLGHTMTNMVHFDYNASTEWDDKIKTIAPFWIWTKNNIPLQFRVLMNQPRWINMYDNARRNWNEMVVDDDDPLGKFKSSNGWVMPFGREDETGWAQVVWNPDFPMMDILSLPLFAGRRDLNVGPLDTGISGSVLSPGLWTTTLLEFMGPVGSLPANLAADAKRDSAVGAKGQVAPVGVNFIANMFNLGGSTPQGDRMLPSFTSSILTTVFPFWMEYADLAGIPANSPYRRANQGFLASESTTSTEGLDQMRRSAQVVGTRVASGFGFKWYTAKDVFFELREIEQFVEDMDFVRRVQQSPPTGNE